MIDLITRLRDKADEIDRQVARTKDDKENGSWGEIELMREAADELEKVPYLRRACEFYAKATDDDWRNDNGFNATAALAN